MTKSASELRKEWQDSTKRVDDQLEKEWWQEMALQLLEVVLINGSRVEDVKKLYNGKVSHMKDISKEVRHTSECTINRGHCSCGSVRTVTRLLNKVYRPQLREMRKAELKNGKG